MPCNVLLAAAAVLLIQAPVAAGAPATGPVAAPAEPAREARLRGDRVVLRFTMVREFPFVAARIAGVRGRLMLDTGSAPALTLNDHRIPLRDGRPSADSHYGSGQVVTKRLNPVVRDVRVGGLRFPVVHDVTSSDGQMLEAVAPDYLGFLGYGAWRGYVLKLDYRRGTATFDRRVSRSLAGERVLAVLPFETRRVANVPVLPLELGGGTAAAIVDTGAYGSLYTSAAIRDRLVAAGTLRPEGGDRYTLVGVRLAGHALPAIPHLPVILGLAPAAAPIGIGEESFLWLGHGFLRSFKTAWDFEGHRLFLLAR